jgi:hypothetical protein
MIGQYLSNTNESGIIPILQNLLEVNKAQTSERGINAYSLCPKKMLF